MLAKGDKIKLVKSIGFFNNVGDIFEVTDVKDDTISFELDTPNCCYTGVISVNQFDNHFEKCEKPKKTKIINTVTPEKIKEIMMDSEITVNTLFDKCTVVACKLPNGFVIVESSACVNPENYDEEMGIDICLQKIENKVWELEGYKLQSDLFELECCEECCCDCDGDCDECLDTDSDCDDCTDYDCPYNTH